MKSALLRLREAREAISPTEREIADYLLQHPEDVIDLSIHELAKRTFSSPSTIIRMCHRIGFEGFKEFRKAITYEMAIRRQNKEAEQKEITRSDSLEDIVEKITYKNIMSLEDTKNLLDTETLEKCVELVRGARMVFYCTYGDILSNLIWCGLMIWLSFCAARGLFYANTRTGEARNRRYFHVGVLCYVGSEYLLWTVGCFWSATSPASPAFWCDLLLTLALLGLLPAVKKAVEV